MSSDGYVRFAGSRYGVHWRYAGQRVQTRLVEKRVQIWAGSRQIAEHALAPAGSTVSVASQWDGIPVVPTRPRRTVLGHSLNAPEVEVRSLLAYRAVAEGEQ